MNEETKWGPGNPHPLSRMKTELVWEGKYDEYGNRRPVSLPDFPLVMQKIETVDEPRDRSRTQGTLFEPARAHKDDFRNRLIWGDNKLALHALLEEFHGQVDLIYIDPPYAVGADFKAKIRLGDSKVLKEHSVLEEVAYRDIWGRNMDSYLHTMFERISLLKKFLKPTGLFYIHADRRMIHMLRAICDEVFGGPHLRNEIIWCYRGGGTPTKDFAEKHDTILRYSISEDYFFDVDPVRIPYSEASSARLQHQTNVFRGDKVYRGYRENADGKHPEDWWAIQPIMPSEKLERADYPTQKPVELIQRIIDSSCPMDGIVLDAFCGSGTTLAVAEGLRVGRDPEKEAGNDKFLHFAPPRKWIGIDLGRFPILTTRKRMIDIQRELYGTELPYRSFDVYNLGRYERQWWQQDRLRGADEGHRMAVLKFFRAQPLENPPSPLIHASKAGAYVHVDKIDSILTLEELREVAKAVHAAGGRKVICLAWEFEMDLRLRARSLETELGLDIQLKYIPREIMEPNRNEIQFFDAAAIEAEAFKREDGSVDIRLKTFLPSLTEVPEKELETLRERALKSPFDFIDFWSIDFEHRDDKPFEHHWQDFRTRKDRSLKTESDARWNFDGKGTRQVCVKVIDVFGIDTTTVLEVKV